MNVRLRLYRPVNVNAERGSREWVLSLGIKQLSAWCAKTGKAVHVHSGKVCGLIADGGV
jgi:hypothetical protein